MEGCAIILSTAPTTPKETPGELLDTWPARDFDEQLERAFRRGKFREGLRAMSYGADIAERWKRGFTPEESREAWRSACDAKEKELDEIRIYSDEPKDDEETARMYGWTPPSKQMHLNDSRGDAGQARVSDALDLG